ncbi:MAG: hypothetical protein H6722_10335 [Sandaracinus sp.]|nr:hypothetical protein [Myxococcales bacterium]MCB9612836.1 hypothetical protein [Sandaracinus sp.]MCB9618183.1 hypothetical protein [Sandaracinus sp.]
MSWESTWLGFDARLEIAATAVWAAAADAVRDAQRGGLPKYVMRTARRLDDVDRVRLTSTSPPVEVVWFRFEGDLAYVGDAGIWRTCATAIETLRAPWLLLWTRQEGETPGQYGLPVTCSTSSPRPELASMGLWCVRAR